MTIVLSTALINFDTRVNLFWQVTPNFGSINKIHRDHPLGPLTNTDYACAWLNRVMKTDEEKEIGCTKMC